MQSAPEEAEPVPEWAELLQWCFEEMEEIEGTEDGEMSVAVTANGRSTALIAPPGRELTLELRQMLAKLRRLRARHARHAAHGGVRRGAAGEAAGGLAPRLTRRLLQELVADVDNARDLMAAGGFAEAGEKLALAGSALGSAPAALRTYRSKATKLRPPLPSTTTSVPTPL